MSRKSVWACSLILGVLLVAAARKRSAPDVVPFLVAVNDVRAGALLRDPERSFKEVYYPRGIEPRDAITTFDQLKGKVVQRPIAAGAPVKTTDIGDWGMDDPDGPPLLPPGTQAVVIREGPRGTVGGFVLPGSRVDVLVWKKNEMGDEVGKVLLFDYLVLAVRVEESGSFVTLAVPEAEVSQLDAVASREKVILLLRGLGDAGRGPLLLRGKPTS